VNQLVKVGWGDGTDEVKSTKKTEIFIRGLNPKNLKNYANELIIDGKTHDQMVECVDKRDVSYALSDGRLEQEEDVKIIQNQIGELQKQISGLSINQVSFPRGRGRGRGYYDPNAKKSSK